MAVVKGATNRRSIQPRPSAAAGSPAWHPARLYRAMLQHRSVGRGRQAARRPRGSATLPRSAIQLSGRSCR